MASTMTTIAFLLMSAMAANAVNLRRQAVTTTTAADPLQSMHDFSWKGIPQDGCPTNWTLYTGAAAPGATRHCYKRFAAAFYDAATATCGANAPEVMRNGFKFPTKTYLAVPNSAAENTFLATTMNPSSDAYTWIGFDYSNAQMWADFTNHEQTNSWRPLYTENGIGNSGAMTNTDQKVTWPVVCMRANGNWRFKPKSASDAFNCEFDLDDTFVHPR